jgi:hypothetical protein
MYLQRMRIAVARRAGHGMTRMDEGAARATTSGLVMLAGRISDDSTSWALPQRKGRNLRAREGGTAQGTRHELVVVEAPHAVAACRLEKVTAFRSVICLW